MKNSQSLFYHIQKLPKAENFKLMGRTQKTVKKYLVTNGGEINHNLIQFLIEHGGHRQYLHKFKLNNSLVSPNCDGVTGNTLGIAPLSKFLRRKETLSEALIPEKWCGKYCSIFLVM